MPKIEEPQSISLFVQWNLDPFKSPRTAEQKSENTKSAVKRTIKHLNSLIDEFPSRINIVGEYDGKVQIIIDDPETKSSSQSEICREIVESLIKNEEVISIEIFVNNDLSESIACNLSPNVKLPWRTDYKGRNSNTLIHHK